MILSVSLEKFLWLTVAPGQSSVLDRRTLATRNDNCEGHAERCSEDSGFLLRTVNCRVRRDSLRAERKTGVLNQGQFSNLHQRRFAIHSMTVATSATQLDVNFGRKCRQRALTTCQLELGNALEGPQMNERCSHLVRGDGGWLVGAGGVEDGLFGLAVWGRDR
jgi:hypothetical protein